MVLAPAPFPLRKTTKNTKEMKDPQFYADALPFAFHHSPITFFLFLGVLMPW
jgi:hypothetical protein